MIEAQRGTTRRQECVWRAPASNPGQASFTHHVPQCLITKHLIDWCCITQSHFEQCTQSVHPVSAPSQCSPLVGRRASGECEPLVLPHSKRTVLQKRYFLYSTFATPSDFSCEINIDIRQHVRVLLTVALMLRTCRSRGTLRSSAGPGGYV